MCIRVTKTAGTVNGLKVKHVHKGLHWVGAQEHMDQILFCVYTGATPDFGPEWLSQQNNYRHPTHRGDEAQIYPNIVIAFASPVPTATETSHGHLAQRSLFISSAVCLYTGRTLGLAISYRRGSGT